MKASAVIVFRIAALLVIIGATASGAYHAGLADGIAASMPEILLLQEMVLDNG
jgi:hypothetical protein